MIEFILNKEHGDLEELLEDNGNRGDFGINFNESTISYLFAGDGSRDRQKSGRKKEYKSKGKYSPLSRPIIIKRFMPESDKLDPG